MSEGSLAGKRTIVIGGSSGIGLAVAHHFLACGSSVVITGRSVRKLLEVRDASGGKLEVASFDASSNADCRTFFQAQREFDHLVLCANSGGAFGPFKDMDDAAWRKYFDNKLWVYLLCIREAIPKLKSGGSITMVNGGAGRFGVPGMSALAVVNGGLDALVRPLALELGPTRVNAIAPGVIDTPYWHKMPDADREAMYAKASAGVPAKRVGTADEVAHAAHFLATNSYVTGIVLDVDGGRRLNPLANA